MGIFSGNDVDDTGDSEVTLKAPDGTDLLGQKTSTGSLPVVIASDQATLQVSIAQSSDLAAGRVFYAAVVGYNLTSAGANNPIFLLTNPSGSGKTMYIFAINGNCQITNVQVGFNLYKSPTVTANGTTFTPVNANIGSSVTSVMNIFTTPTVSSSGTLLVADQVGQNSNSSNMVITQLIAIQPTFSALITGNPFSNNRAVIMSVGWIEK